MLEQQIHQLVEVLKKSHSILFITGAGMSADSGLPTYRGVGGLYNNDDTEEGIPIELALSGGMFRQRPEVTWKYISQIESSCRGASFNRGHEVIAQMEKKFHRVWVLTQNVDGFHLQAGNQNVIDVHGDLHNLYCLVCSWETWVEDYQDLEIPPKCPHCRGLIRPDVVLFDEMLSSRKMNVLYEQMSHGFDVIFSIGTTSSFPYIAQPVLFAKQQGDFTVEINPTQTNISHEVDVKISDSAAKVLDLLWKNLEA